MFRRLAEDTGDAINVSIDGRPFDGVRGDSVASILILAGRMSFRKSSNSGRPRGPYCMMGVCFECLVRIDGVDGRQACLVEIGNGMTIETYVNAAAK